MRLARVALIAASIVLVTGLFSPPAQAGISFSAFYSNLSPYGSWQVSAQYGRVWQPSVYYSGWNPYYDGNWVYSDYGWTWVSDYEWGAIPYHYGTWVADPYYGWVWVPGYTWAPSWVVFRTGPDYIGWAPVSPSFSVGVSFGFGVPTASPFVFVPARSFCAPRVGHYFVPHSRTGVIINSTRIVNNLVVENNVVVNRGFNPRVVEKAGGRRVREVPIERVSRVVPGSRFNRAEIGIDSQRASRGLRAAEPVSAKSALPDVRRGRADVENRRGGGQPTREQVTQVAPRAPRRETGDLERQRGGGQSTSDRATQNLPRAPRNARNSQSAYRDYPSAPERVQSPRRSNTMRPQSASPSEMRSIQRPTRQAPPDRQPGPTARSSTRKAGKPEAIPPSEKKPPSQKRDNRRGSGSQ